MKVVVWFFSLWLLVLAGLPCPDAECHAQATQATPSQTSHSDDDHKAPCSPFCHCITCPGFALPRLLAYKLPDQPIVRMIVPQAFQYQSLAPSSIAFAIWQPPKI